MPNIFLPVLALAAGLVMMAGSSKSASAAPGNSDDDLDPVLPEDTLDDVPSVTDALDAGEYEDAFDAAVNNGSETVLEQTADKLDEAGLNAAAEELRKKAEAEKKKKAEAEKKTEADRATRKKLRDAALKSKDVKFIEDSLKKLKDLRAKNPSVGISKEVEALEARIKSLKAEADKKKKAEADKKKKEAEKAAKEKDYQAAVAKALASGDEKTVKSVADMLKKAGKTKQAEDMLQSFAAAQKEKREAEAKKKAEEDKKRKAEEAKKLEAAKKKRADLLKKGQSQTKENEVKATIAELKKLGKDAGIGVSKEVDALEKKLRDMKAKVPVPVAVKPKEPKGETIPVTIVVSPKASKAKAMNDMLAKSKRYSENQAQVKEYQSDNGLTADGKYGRASAMSLWNLYQILPTNPYYWPASPAAALAEYDKFLQGIVKSNPEHAAKVGAPGKAGTLRGTLGK